MANGVGTPGANLAVNAVCSAITHAQFHVGAPGAAGTANVAVNSTRVTAAFAAAAAGSAATSAVIESDSVPATETYTDISFWDAAVAGNFLVSGTIVGGSVSAGNNFVIAIGDYTVSVPLAS